MRLKQILDKKEKIVSIFFTAGYPKQGQIKQICIMLEKAGVNMIEIGIPSSDPLADGPIIQQSSTIALENMTTLNGIFEELATLRQDVSIPVLLMGYYNQILQFGIQTIVELANKIGLDGFIIPDAPNNGLFHEYCKKHGLANVKLICPTTSNERIKYLDELSSGFLYAVSSSSTTGNNGFASQQYLETLKYLGLKNKIITGFGIKDSKTFKEATKNTSGGIIGSAFVQLISELENINQQKFNTFVSQFK
jgi:tryptophan synthase alpha chain